MKLMMAKVAYYRIFNNSIMAFKSGLLMPWAFTLTTCIFISCGEKPIPKDNLNSKQIKYDSSQYPCCTYICFTSNASKNKVQRFKLGDSLWIVKQYLDLERDFSKFTPTYVLKGHSIERSGKGKYHLSAVAIFDHSTRLNSFEATLTYIPYGNKNSMDAFAKFIENHFMGCVWEEMPNIFKPADTLRRKHMEMSTQRVGHIWQFRCNYF